MRWSIWSLLLALLLVNVAVSLDKERDCKCRMQSRQKRIIGGGKAGLIPWFATITLNKAKVGNVSRVADKYWGTAGYRCGATIIDERWVMTAAHCVDRFVRSDSFHVGYGGNGDLYEIFERNQYAKVEAIHKHPKFDKSKRGNDFNDIALVKLRSPLNFTEAVQPACLPDHHEDHYDGPLQITGFGSVIRPVNGITLISYYLKVGNTYDVSDNPGLLWSCPNATQICHNRKYWSHGAKTCSGDSGGLVHQTKGGRSTVIGLISYGRGINLPGITIDCVGLEGSTRVSAYMEWIKETVANEICL